MASEDNGKKGVGIPEVATGAVVGAGVGVGTTAAYGAVQFLKDGDPMALAERISKATAGTEINTIVGGKVQVTEGLIDHAKKIVRLEAPYHDAGRIGKLGIAFSSMTTPTKIGVGAIALGTALAVGYGVNAWRNSGNHVDRLNGERAPTGQIER